MLRIFEGRMLRMIYGPIKHNGIWRTRYSNELYMLYDELDIVEVIKIGRLRWLEHLFRMQELDPCRKLTVLKSEGIRRVGKPKLMWLESVEENLKNMGVGELETKVAGPRAVGGQFWKRLRFSKGCNVRRR